MVEAKFVLRYEDIRSSSADALAEQMDSAADQNLSVVMPHFFDVLGRTCEVAGTVSHAGGKPFSFEALLAGLEKIQIPFDDKGNLELPTLIVHPEIAKVIRAMPPVTPEQRRLLDDLIDRKRKDHYASRRDRKLR
jgi:hypothetical protein